MSVLRCVAAPADGCALQVTWEKCQKLTKDEDWPTCVPAKRSSAAHEPISVA